MLRIRMSMALVISLFVILCAVPSRGRADVFTVGPGGQFSTLEAALAAMQRAGGEAHEIRLATGVFEGAAAERILLTSSITLTGGWNSRFDARVDDPNLTHVVGRDAHRALGSLFLPRGSSRIANMTLEGGRHCHRGAALELNLWGHAGVSIEHVRVRGNLAWDSGSPASCGGQALGGGISILTSEHAVAAIRDTEFSSNYSVAPLEAGAGALQVTAEGDARVEIERVTIADNGSVSTEGVAGAALSIVARDRAVVRAIDSMIHENRAYVLNYFPTVRTRGGTSNLGVVAIDQASVLLDRLQVRGGVTSGLYRHAASGSDAIGARASVALTSAGGTPRLWFSNSVVARSDGIGIYGFVLEADGRGQSGRIGLVNLSVVDNAATGIFGFSGFPSMLVSNSIATGNGLEIQPSDYFPAEAGTVLAPGWLQSDLFVQGLDADWSNLIGVRREATFLAPDQGDYRLRSGSSARDRGNNTPFDDFGVGELDAGRGMRIWNGRVDIGAYEYGVVGFVRNYTFR